MHEKMYRLLKKARGHIDYLAYCPHGPSDNCHCRKPSPGLLFEISEALEIPLTEEVIVVGDSIRDLEAAEAAGCSWALVKTGKGQTSAEKLAQHKSLKIQSTKVYTDLLDFVNHQI